MRRNLKAKSLANYQAGKKEKKTNERLGGSPGGAHRLEFRKGAPWEEDFTHCAQQDLGTTPERGGLIDTPQQKRERGRQLRSGTAVKGLER